MTTVIVKLHLPMLPATSEAAHSTLWLPRPKKLPEGGADEDVPPEASEA